MIEQIEERLNSNMIETINHMAKNYKDTHKEDNLEEESDTMLAMQSALSTITGNLSKQNKDIMKFLKTMAKKMDRIEMQCNKENVDTSNENALLNPKTGKAWRRYCWTHGCCNH